MKKTITHLTILFVMALFTLSCSNDDDSMPNPVEVIHPKEYKLQLWGSSDPNIAYPLNITYYKDNESGELIIEEVNSETNTDVIQSRNLISNDKLGFKLTVGNGGEAPVSIVIITDIESNEVIFESYSLQVNTGKTFMFDISDNSYSIQ